MTIVPGMGLPDYTIGGSKPNNQIISTTGFETLWSTKGKSTRFSPLRREAPRVPDRGFLIRMAELSVAFSPPSLKLRRALLAIHSRPPGRDFLSKESNGPRLHGGNPTCLRRQVGNVPAASRGVS
ncbi:MAG: hypothetical protein O7C72_10980 [Deltaproteobacteria bacterium]|nr:hypothetical protein [Deltaproteobacteria bacterium]